MEFLRITATDGTKKYIPDNYVVSITTSADTLDGGSDYRAPNVVRGRITNVKYYGAKGDNIQDDSDFIQRAINSSSKRDIVDKGTFLVTKPLIIPNGKSIHGIYNGKISSESIINHTGSGELFVTDKAVNGFNGIEIKGIRIIGGVANKYAIESHYPYTFIDKVQIENISGNYLGNGINLTR